MGGRAIIAGGSIGGLFAAAMLRRAGWEVIVLERARAELAGRGAGIVTHDLLVRLIEAAGAETTDLGVQVMRRVAFDMSGAVTADMPLPQVVTSWERVHSSLRRLMPEGSYRLGHSIAAVEDLGTSVRLRTEEGAIVEGDIAIGADGFRSAVRGSVAPGTGPEWSGYVVWRALATEADLPAHIRRDVFEHFAFFLPAGSQILTYPIAGPDNDLRPGHRRLNLVWYLPVRPEALDDMLTDAEGRRHDMTIPPPLIRDEVLGAMMESARARLARPFVEILEHAERPFFTPIYDHLAPVFARGRIALAGDAASVARPHVGMGVTKAAADAEALARHLGQAEPVPALRAYSAERHAAAALAHGVGRTLGSWIVSGGGRDDGTAHPREREFLAQTAVVPARPLT